MCGGTFNLLSWASIFFFFLSFLFAFVVYKPRNSLLRENPCQNGRKMTSFRGAMAKLGAGVDNELGGSALHQCR